MNDLQILMPENGGNHTALRFLIVDNHNFARKTLRQMVSDNPSWMVVGEAATGVEAIARMAQRPDVVLMDIVMPVMDGIEATRRIKKIRPETIVILITAYQDKEFRTRSLESGADGFVLKDDLTTEVLQEILLGRVTAQPGG